MKLLINEDIERTLVFWQYCKYMQIAPYKGVAILCGKLVGRLHWRVASLIPGTKLVSILDPGDFSRKKADSWFHVLLGSKSPVFLSKY